MRAIGLSYFRDHLAAELARVVDGYEPVLITRGDRQPVVMLAHDDYRSLRETAYLMRSPANTRHLLKSMDQLERS